MRAVFIGISVVIGWAVGHVLDDSDPLFGLVGAGIGAGLGGSLVLCEKRLHRLSVPDLFGSAVGFSLGVVLAGVIALTGIQVLPEGSATAVISTALLFVALPYLGTMIGSHVGSQGIRGMASVQGPQRARTNSEKLLDTSVIIDGRIADLCETGFIEGCLLIPHFILQELQHISDSSDSLKRARGRRGLDILNHIQKIVDVEVKIIDDDFPQIKEVDAKLVELAKKLDAKILTNDLNLNKVAGIQGVKVLNINELCNALKPVVLPGETIRVFVLKEGKEAGQGVAYLDDGTMVVVDNAKRCIGKNLDVVVTSVLQTSAGRMIFTRLKEETDRDILSFARG